MKTALLAAGFAALASLAAADPVAGVWKTQPGDDGNYGHVTIAPCGAEICGVISAAFDSSGSPIASDNIGKRMIWGMKAKGGGKYSGGKIWAPDRDKVYRSKMTHNGRDLRVEGCIGPICRAQNWTLVN